MAAYLLRNQSRRGDEKRDTYIFIIELKRVTIVAIVFAEGLAVITQNDPKRLLVKTSTSQPVNARAQRDIAVAERVAVPQRDRKSTRLNSSHVSISYAVFCLKK